jgi:hypothetical protein
VALHRSALLEESAFEIVVHLVFCHVLVFAHWLVVHEFAVLKGRGHLAEAEAHAVLRNTGFFDDSLMHPEGHLLLYQILRNLQLVAQLLRRNPILSVSHLFLIEVGDHDGLDGKALELEVSVIEGESEVDVSQIVVEEYFPHGFDFSKAFAVLLKDGSHFRWHVEGAGVFVVDGPVAFGDRETAEFFEGDGGSGGDRRSFGVDDSVIALGILDVFEDDVAGLES